MDEKCLKIEAEEEYFKEIKEELKEYFELNKIPIIPFHLSSFPSSPLSVNLGKDIETSLTSHLFTFHEKNLPRRYILNENACVCFWKDGYKTVSIRHKEDEFDKSMGFLMCCFQYYNRDLSRNKRKKVLSWLKQENIKDYLFDLFVTENNMTIKEAKAYLKDLKIESDDPEKTEKELRNKRIKELENKIRREMQKKKAKHMKEDK